MDLQSGQRAGMPRFLGAHEWPHLRQDSLTALSFHLKLLQLGHLAGVSTMLVQLYPHLRHSLRPTLATPSATAAGI